MLTIVAVAVVVAVVAFRLVCEFAVATCRVSLAPMPIVRHEASIALRYDPVEGVAVPFPTNRGKS